VTNDRRNYVVVGFFVLGMLTLLIVWLAMLSGRTGPSTQYTIHYDAVMGLAEGTQVFFQGYPSGVIDEIVPADELGRGFRIDVSLSRRLSIPEDSVALITSSGLLSAVVIDIRAGSSKRALGPGDRIASREAANLFELGSDFTSELSDLVRSDLRPLLASINQNAPEIFENLNAFTARLDATLDRLDALLGDDHRQNVTQTLANVESASSDAAKLVSELRSTRALLDDVATSVREFLAENRTDLRQATRDLSSSLDAFADHAGAISRNLEETTRNMNEVSAQLRQDPSIVVRGRKPAGDPVEHAQ
jgi:phospholipid/cholesterol/gamma-HCH transport system substrate-binding protein